MKKGYRLAEVCRLLDLQPYVLRYWATEFSALAVDESPGGAARSYSDTDLELLQRIKRLLYEEGYTIAGARKKLESDPSGAGSSESVGPLFAEPPADSVTTPRAEVQLDSVDDERIETFRRSLAAVLDEARELLVFLERRR